MFASVEPEKAPRERGLCELYGVDPERADYLVFGRRAKGNRRGFLNAAGLASMGALIGAAIPYHSNLPSGLIPAAFADSLKDFTIVGKDGLIVLNDRPINAETPAHLLNDDVTPNARHFVRNNGIPPKLKAMDPNAWVLTIDGEVNKPLSVLSSSAPQHLIGVLHLATHARGKSETKIKPIRASRKKPDTNYTQVTITEKSGSANLPNQTFKVCCDHESICIEN